VYTFTNAYQKLGSRINREPKSANKNIILGTENKISPWHVNRMDVRGRKNHDDGKKNRLMRSVMNCAANKTTMRRTRDVTRMEKIKLEILNKKEQ
jgi:hypothetical protein